MKVTLIITLLMLVIFTSCTSPTSTPTPVSTPTMAPRPTLAAEPVWSEDYYFPRFPQPQQIYVIRVESGLEDWYRDPRRPNWRINQSNETMTSLTLVDMQGVINRSDPAVYLDWQDSGKLRDAAHFWLTPLAEYVDLTPLDVEGTSAVEFLWQVFSPRFRGAVIYDPNVPDTINLATMLTGVEDRLMFAPDQLELPAIRAILDELEKRCAPDANPLNLPTLEGYRCAIDLRLLVEQQGWREPAEDWEALSASRYSIYEWVYEHLWSRLEKRAIGIISPGAPSSRWLQDAQFYDPLNLACRDYLIALRIPALWLSTGSETESALLSRFLDEAPSPIPLLTFFDGDEGGTLELASRHGDWIPVISNTNTPISTGNLTVLSAIDVPVQAYAAPIDDDHLFATLDNPPIVTLWSSDGDSIQILMDRGVHGGIDFYWDGVRGTPFGLSINPTLANLSPLAWNYYVETAQGTTFVAGFSGAGYTSPPLMDDSQLERYLEYTYRYMALTGLRTLYVDEHFGPLDERIGALYYKHLEAAGYLGAFTTFSVWPELTETFVYPGVPAPVVRQAFLLTYGKGDSILQALLGVQPGKTLFDFPVIFSEGKPVTDPSAVGEQAIRLSRPELASCCLVFGGPRMTLAPGTYTAIYRLKVEDNQSQLPFAHLMLLRQVGEGQRLFNRTIAPADFSRVGEWLDFSVAVTLDEFVSDVQLWLDYTGGTQGNANADLYFDTITLQREGGSALPIALPIYIGLVGSTDPVNEDLRLVTEEFVNRGGLLLTPDEMMATLNPEYMIEWATPVLGPDDPALVEAQRLLDDGQFLQSLYTIREALRAFPERTYISSDGNATLQANAWVTDLELDSQTGSLVFHTHSSPTAEIHIMLQLPKDLFGETSTVTVGNSPITAKFSSDGKMRLVEFVLTGGPHEVRVSKP